jgi:hypothetical protein
LRCLSSRSALPSSTLAVVPPSLRHFRPRSTDPRARSKGAWGNPAPESPHHRIVRIVFKEFRYLSSPCAHEPRRWAEEDQEGYSGLPFRACVISVFLLLAYRKGTQLTANDLCPYALHSTGR